MKKLFIGIMFFASVLVVYGIAWSTNTNSSTQSEVEITISDDAAEEEYEAGYEESMSEEELEEAAYYEPLEDDENGLAAENKEDEDSQE